jgi:5-methyltetrahydrofolate--homocysteine methyltransferase
VIGTRMLKNYDLAEIEKYIDWGPFFQAWGSPARIPRSCRIPVVGEEARKVLAEGRAMLKKIVEGRWLTASAVFGLFPRGGRSRGHRIYADDTRTNTLHGLAQPAPAEREADRPAEPLHRRFRGAEGLWRRRLRGGVRGDDRDRDREELDEFESSMTTTARSC